MAFTPGTIIDVAKTEDGITYWNYKTTDTIATVEGAGYFNSYAKFLGINHKILVQASDNLVWYYVSVWTVPVDDQGVALTNAAASVTIAKQNTSALLNASVVVQTFTGSGTYTPTAGMKFCIIELVGGGGGGGGATGTVGNYYAGGGGASGGYSRTRCTAAQIGASQTATIGAAGNGGVGSNNGTAGGDTSIGTLCIAKGGGGGLFASAAQVPIGGTPGPSGTGDLTARGVPGGGGTYETDVAAVHIHGGSGFGGSSFFGGGGLSITSSGANVSGVAAGEYGSGGSGGSAYNSANGPTGGAGSAGFIVITEYIL